ncbi:MAG: hypothetical protein AMXMBFR64_44030 [Myxococcales bacterium]
MTAVSRLLELLGSLGVFLLGMKLMSEALQNVAGDRMKGLLGRMTANRLSGVATGVGVTIAVQSSSATTVMVVSFVTAGLLTLTQSISVIMGANIGTTMTAWIVAVFGFKVKIAAFALPAIGIGFLMSFLKTEQRRLWGEALVGFGLLFLGLALLKDAVPSIDDPEQLAWVGEISGYGFGSVLLFMALGTALTVVLQSSSATTTLTLTLAAVGWINYEVAVGMVLGENIGTTATANLAAIGASVDAKRAARAHTLFNLFGAAWALALMHVYLLPVVDLLVPGDPHGALGAGGGDAAAAGVVSMHLAAFHSLFNVTNTTILVPFVGVIERIVRRWVPSAQEAPVVRRAQHLSLAYIETPELLLVQAGKELRRMTDEARTMFRDAMEIITHPDRDLGGLVERTLEREAVCDDLEREIIDHLTLTAQSSTTTETSRRIAALIQNTHRVERIADHCAVMVRIARRNYESGRRFTPETIAELVALGALVDRALANLGVYLAEGSPAKRAEEIEHEIDDSRRDLRAKHIEDMSSFHEDLKTGLAFLDMITHMEEIGDRVTGIVRLSESARRA